MKARRWREERTIYELSQGQLIWHKFRKHEVAVVSGYLLAALYISSLD